MTSFAGKILKPGRQTSAAQGCHILKPRLGRVFGGICQQEQDRFRGGGF
jgi:hypothetical protein